MATRLYFNPSCSKCRSAQAILQEHHIEAEIVRYLETPPTVDELEALMRMLSIDDPRLMMRAGEPEYDALAPAGAGKEELLQAIAEHPQLLERPIYVSADRAVIGRPPERLLEFL